MKVLELGCGTGDMWKNSQSLIKACSKLILSDFSEGMVATTKSNIGNYENTEYKVIDIQEIPYENETSDVKSYGGSFRNVYFHDENFRVSEKRDTQAFPKWEFCDCGSYCAIFNYQSSFNEKSE